MNKNRASAHWPSDSAAVEGFAQELGLDAREYAPLITAGLHAIAVVFSTRITQLRPPARLGREIAVPSWRGIDPFAVVLEVEKSLGLQLSDVSSGQMGDFHGLTIKEWMNRLTQARFYDMDGNEGTWSQLRVEN
jgi:hypothetical protein